MAALFALSSIPGDASPDTTIGALFDWVSPTWQNLLHIPLYTGLCLSWIWALDPVSLNPRKRLVIAFALTAVWSALDETHQIFVPGRYASLTDLALDLAGAGLAVYLTWRMRSPARGLKS